MVIINQPEEREVMTPFEVYFKRMTKPWVLASFVALMALFFLYTDKPVALFCYDFKFGYFQPILEIITNLGKKTRALGILFVLAIIFRYILHRRQWEMRAWFLWLCTFVPSLIVLGLKVLFGRARPELFIHEKIYGFQWIKFERLYWSFPSGHTATMMGCMFGLCIVWPRYRWGFLGLGFLVMLSRILLYQHYVSDVLVSAYLALIEVGVLHWLLRRYAPQFMKEVYA